MWTIINKYRLPESVATSFICAYCALWLALLYDAVAIFYNYCYEQITKTTDASTGAKRPDGSTDTQADPDAVSKMQ